MVVMGVALLRGLVVVVAVVGGALVSDAVVGGVVLGMFYSIAAGWCSGSL